MSKIRLTGSNSGYVEIASAADAGNLTFVLPTSGTSLLGNGNNVYTGITTFTNDFKLEGGSYDVLWDASDNQLEFDDNAKLSFGASSDLQIFHDGNNSFINEVGNGSLYVRAQNTFNLQKAGTSDFMLKSTTDGSVDLYFANSKKFETTNTGVVVTGICSATSFSGSGEGLTRTTQLSHRNIIINGACMVAQRGTSSGSVGYQTVDRFKLGAGGADEVPQQYQGTLGSHESPYNEGHRYTYYIVNGNQTSGAGAGDYAEIQYKVEARDMATCGWDYTSASSYITLSFWVKSSVGQNFYGFVYSADGTAQRYIFQTGNITANSWNKIVVTIPGGTNVQFDNDVNEGFIIKWIPFYGTDKTNNSATVGSWANYNGAARCPDNTTTWWTTNNSTFFITGIQLEVGQQATPFEHRSYGEELARCQRYFFRMKPASNYSAYGMGGAYSSTQAVALMYFPVPLRASPTFTYNGNLNEFYDKVGGGSNFTSIAVTQVMGDTTTGVPHLELLVLGSFTAGNLFILSSLNNTSTYLDFNSEL